MKPVRGLETWVSAKYSPPLYQRPTLSQFLDLQHVELHSPQHLNTIADQH